MTELYVLRHADAGDPEAWTGPDEARPLSGKGEKQVDRLGRFLAGVGFAPGAILTSPKVRAKQTAEGVAAHLDVPVTVDDRLGENVTLPTLDRLLADAGRPERPMIVGHDPDFTELVEELCGSSRVPMPKGALARIDVDGPFEAGRGTLRWLVPPDLLKPKS